MEKEGGGAAAPESNKRPRAQVGGDRVSAVDESDPDLRIARLDSVQRLAVSRVIRERPLSTIVVGAAGVGKSEVVRAMRRLMDINGIKYKLTAATGVAAFNIGGETLHRATGLPLDPCGSLYEMYMNLWRFKTAHRVLKWQVLVIDEFFMLDARVIGRLDELLRCCLDIVRSNSKTGTRKTLTEEAEEKRLDMFDYEVMDRLVAERIADLPLMGGKAVVGSGDPRQFKPIGPRLAGQAQVSASLYPFEWPKFDRVWPRPSIVLLTRIYRQGEDLEFSRALTQLGEGNLTHPSVIRMLARCTVPLSKRTGVPPDVLARYEAVDPVKLYSRNEAADVVNERFMETLPGPTYEYMPRTVPSTEFVYMHRNGARVVDPELKAIQSGIVDAHNRSKMLRRPARFRIGQKFMVIRNMDGSSLSRPIYNGCTGVITHMCTVEEWCSLEHCPIDPAEVGAYVSDDSEDEDDDDEPPAKKRNPFAAFVNPDAKANRARYDVERVTPLQWVWYMVAHGTPLDVDLSDLPKWAHEAISSIRAGNMTCIEPTLGRECRFPVIKRDDGRGYYFCLPHVNRDTYRRNLAATTYFVPGNACNAITTHKSQGATMFKVEASMDNMPCNGLYVAASRATSEHGLYITDFTGRVETDPTAVEWMNRIKATAKRTN